MYHLDNLYLVQHTPLFDVSQILQVLEKIVSLGPSLGQRPVSLQKKNLGETCCIIDNNFLWKYAPYLQEYFISLTICVVSLGRFIFHDKGKIPKSSKDSKIYPSLESL
jgi:hypothetical protein